MTVVAAASNIRTQLFTHLESDATLLGMLPQGVNSILPRRVLSGGQWREVDPAAAQKPFIFVSFDGGGPVGYMQPDSSTYALEVHDRPGYGYVDIDRILAQLKWRLDGAEWQPATATLPAYHSWWAGASGELPDPGLQTMKRIGRIQVLQS